MTNTELIEVAGLAVELVRKPIKNLHIGVYPPDGHVRVAAPPAINDEAVRIAVVTRLGWIKQKKREFENQARQSAREYVTGETHYVWGRPLRLTVRTSDTNRCTIESQASDRLLLKVPAGATTDQKARWIGEWYRAQLKERAKPLVQKWAERLNVDPPGWGVRIMRTKWGSCNPERRSLWVNLELAKKPVQALDYVILHEMAHFISPVHDELFVSVLDRHMPAWRQVRADLNAMPLSV